VMRWDETARTCLFILDPCGVKDAAETGVVIDYMRKVPILRSLRRRPVARLDIDWRSWDGVDESFLFSRQRVADGAK
jgi:hypothetical protein